MNTRPACILLGLLVERLSPDAAGTSFARAREGAFVARPGEAAVGTFVARAGWAGSVASGRAGAGTCSGFATPSIQPLMCCMARPMS